VRAIWFGVAAARPLVRTWTRDVNSPFERARGIGLFASGERSEQRQLGHLKLAKLSLIRADRGQNVVAGQARLWYLGGLGLPRGCRARGGMRAEPPGHC